MAPTIRARIVDRMATGLVPIHVDIWTDVVCPWCYIGKRRFERAVAELAGEVDVEVMYRAFQLDPDGVAGVEQPVAEAYAKKFGGRAGAGDHRAGHRRSPPRKGSSSAWTAHCGPTRCSRTD